VQVRLSAETVAQPVQLESSEPAGTSATSVTVLPFGADPTHVPVFAAQAMSGSVSVDVIVPCAAPETAAVFAVSWYGAGWNVAITVFAAFIASVHVPVPEQAPDHPTNREPVAAVAVRVTCWPSGTTVVQPLAEAVLQSIPGPLTVPAALPDV
jgi:hypothetical protein